MTPIRSVRRSLLPLAGLLALPSSLLPAQESAVPPGDGSPNQGADSAPASVVITATRLPTDADRAPAAVTVIPAEELAQRQTDRVADALRAVPGLSVAQTGAPGQLTSVFTRGLESRHTQVLLDGVPLNQGLAGLFNFADLTGEGLGRIEVQRGPQSTLYGPRALAGAIQLFSRRGDDGEPGSYAHGPVFDTSMEGGSFSTFRERAAITGFLKQTVPSTITDKGMQISVDHDYRPPFIDYSVAASRLDTDNDRLNNQYRNTAVLVNLGLTPIFPSSASPNADTLRIGLIALYSNSDTGNPGAITFPRPKDNLLTERQLFAPNIDWQATSWWHHHLVLDYDKERQVNNPNEDGFTGATRGQFNRYQLDYQNDIAFAHWLTLTTGVFYEQTFADQRRPFIDQTFGPQAQFIKDFTENEAVFAQFSVEPFKNALLVAGGRVDHFNQFGTQGTYRFAGSYLWDKTGTTVRGSVATGYAPPTPQDRIFSSTGGAGLEPEESFGYDFGFEQGLLKDRLRFGGNYFYNDLSNVIGFNNVTFATLNLGSARTRGVEAFSRWEPVKNLFLRASYTYLDAVNTSGGEFGNLAPGARLPRRPRNEFFGSIAYRTPFAPLTLGFEAKVVNGREDITFNAFGNPVNIDLGGYTNLRLLADYEVNRHLHVYGRVENLGGQRYEEVAGYPALGRGFFGGMSARF